MFFLLFFLFFLHRSLCETLQGRVRRFSCRPQICCGSAAQGNLFNTKIVRHCVGATDRAAAAAAATPPPCNTHIRSGSRELESISAVVYNPTHPPLAPPPRPPSHPASCQGEPAAAPAGSCWLLVMDGGAEPPSPGAIHHESDAKLALTAPAQTEGRWACGRSLYGR